MLVFFYIWQVDRVERVRASISEEVEKKAQEIVQDMTNKENNRRMIIKSVQESCQQEVSVSVCLSGFSADSASLIVISNHQQSSENLELPRFVNFGVRAYMSTYAQDSLRTKQSTNISVPDFCF